MELTHTRVKDVHVTDTFLYDWDHSPERARKTLDRYLKIISYTGRLPNGLNAHKAFDRGDLWIGYISNSAPGWRILFSIDNRKEMVLEHLLTHSEMDVILKDYI